MDCRSLAFCVDAAQSAPLTLNGITRNDSGIVIAFQATEGVSYRLERKLALTDATWQRISGVDDLTATSSGPAQITDPGAVNLGRAFYRVSVTTAPSVNVWISKRTDGVAGTGTQADPFDGSTQAQFDEVMSGIPANTWIHLGPGTFRTSVTKPWWVKPGWVVEGAGMDQTTVQLTGNVAGKHTNVVCFESSPNVSSDYIVLRDLTCDANWAELSATADTGLNGEKNIKTGALALYGSNNLVQRVRSINTYGSWPNKQEQFAILVVGPRTGDGTGNVIDSCKAELPQGTYGSPFALHGWTNSLPHHLITNSKVVACTVNGVNNGQHSGFTSGGVNLSNVKDCEIDRNTFTDCFAVAYIDTGSVDGLRITNNTLIRGWLGVGMSSWVAPKQGIEIRNNNFLIQTRIVGGASYGMVIGYGPTSNVTIDSNTITFDLTGAGLKDFWGIAASGLNNATITNNTIGFAYFVVNNSASGTNVITWNNLQTDGTPAPGL